MTIGNVLIVNIADLTQRSALVWNRQFRFGRIGKTQIAIGNVVVVSRARSTPSTAVA